MSDPVRRGSVIKTPPTDRGTAFIVDDDKGFRESLAFLLKSVHLNARCFATAQEFFRAYTPDQPSCLLLDIRLPDLSGLRVQRILKRSHVSIPVIIVSGHASVPTVVSAMREGAIDVLEKPVDEQRLLDAVQQALAADAERRTDLERTRTLLEKLNRLTPRERQVMNLITEGRLNKEIAYDLGISVKTVEEHRARVKEKMQAGDVATLVRMVIAVESMVANAPPSSEENHVLAAAGSMGLLDRSYD